MFLPHFKTFLVSAIEVNRWEPLGHNMTEIYAWYGVLSSPSARYRDPLKIYDMPYMLLYPDPPSTHFFVLSFSRVPRNIWYLLLKKARGRGRGVLAHGLFFFPKRAPISKDETPICCRPYLSPPNRAIFKGTVHKSWKRMPCRGYSGTPAQNV